MNQPVIHLHLVSEAAGRTLSLANRAASSLWPGVPIVEHIHPPLVSRDLLRGILRDIERQPGIVIYNLSDPVAIRNLKEGCAATGSRTLAMPSDASGVAPDATLNAVMRLNLEPPPRTWFRVAAGIFAGILALQALWILPVALIHPTITFPPADTAIPQAVASQGLTHASALIGIIRGDLWADYAFVLADESIRTFEDVNGVAAPRLLDPARGAAKRAAELVPHDSRVWLLLAALDSLSNRNSGDVSSELKNSYYTGPNERTLRPLRLRVALASDAISDSELQFLVTQELRAIILRDPALKSSIVSAYRHSSVDGRRFVQGAVGDLDPDFLIVLHKADQPD
jgi:hypothetical protein